jgi:hypothetical protein
MQSQDTLDEYVDLAGLRPAVEPAFLTDDSIRWFCRQHREALAEAGALILVAGRLRFHISRFKQAAVQIGRQAAARRVA